MKKSVVAALAVVVLLAVVSIVWVATQSPPSENRAEFEPTGESVDGLEEYYSQEVEWEDCGEAALCADVTVPIDHSDPAVGDTTLRMRRIPAEGQGTGKVLFVNPGGPGGSAQDYAEQFAASTSAAVRRAYDVVGVDPRGVGQSSPLECLPAEEFDDVVGLDPDPETDAEARALFDAAVDLGEACLANSGDLARFVSTADAARDHDIVRAVLGQDELHWFGASYGTVLGATYADLFPQNVGTMILDGAVDPTLSDVEASLGQATGFQRAVESYAASCAKDRRCDLGDSRQEVLDTIAGLMESLEDDPIALRDGREFTQGWAFYGLILPLYAEGNWPALTQGLELWQDGDPSFMVYLADLYFDREDGEYTTNGGQAIYAVNCLDSDERGTLTPEIVRDELVPRFEKVSPQFGEVLAWGTVSCSSWPIESVTPQQPTEAKGAVPILVLGTTLDPATPYEWSQALAKQLESGVLVTREGDGHTAYNAGNACIEKLVDAFLVDGEVPEDGTVCRP